MTIFGHRGASAVWDDNTVEAFAGAVELGADWGELDVRPSADGALVVLHDAHLPDGRAVAEVAAADLPPSVCLLDAALDACGPLGVNVEIKSDPNEPGFDEARSLAAPVLAAIRGWGGTTIVSSFDPAMVDRVRELDADVPTGQLTLLPTEPPEEIVADIVRRGHGWWHPWTPVLDAAGVGAAKAAGVGINTYTTDDPARIVELASWGVDGVVTNDISLALRALGRPAP